MTILLAALAALLRRRRRPPPTQPDGRSLRHGLAMLDGRLLRDIGLEDAAAGRR